MYYCIGFDNIVARDIDIQLWSERADNGIKEKDKTFRSTLFCGTKKSFN